MRPFLVILLVCVGCAEGSVGGDSDAGSGTDVGTNDASTPRDTGNTTVQDASTGCGVCCPGERSCADPTTASVCKSDGSGTQLLPCVGDEVCMNGTCSVEPVCTPGEKSCYDTSTVLTCRQTGHGFTTSPCPTDTTCIDGQCLSGAGIGQPCTADGDCASAQCHCDAAEGCTGITGGYCTTPCAGGDCGRDGACFAASVAPLGNAAADYDHCVTKCTPGSCPTGQACITVPTKTAEGIVWEQACYFPGFVGIGSQCSSDSQCIGGRCLLDYYDIGFCTRTCTDDGVCPENSACVSLVAPGYQCSTYCGDGSALGSGSCPFVTPNPLQVACRPMSDLNNNAYRVCYSP